MGDSKFIDIHILADKETRKERARICSGCPFNKNGLSCLKCGCLLPAKISLKRSKCPLDKWEN